MGRNWSSGADRLATIARAAGFAMATPDDAPEPAAVKQPAVIGGWTSKPPRALIVARREPVSYQSWVRDWMSSLIWRAPA